MCHPTKDASSLLSATAVLFAYRSGSLVPPGSKVMAGNVSDGSYVKLVAGNVRVRACVRGCMCLHEGVGSTWQKMA